MNRPTPEQCTSNARWTDDQGFRCMAFWWPQMGGYVGRAVARREPAANDDDGCMLLFVWHDGEFPFHDMQEEEGGGRQPAVIHICCPDQWTAMGQLLEAFDADPDPGLTKRPEGA